MRLRFWFACLAALYAQDPAENSLPRDLLVLSKTRLRVREILKNQPNYTCSQTIERSRRRAARQKWELVDTLRLEVAYVDGKEMFAWPGAIKFEDRELVDMVGGTIGNGDFALFTKGVFLGSSGLKYDGEEQRDGRQLIRFRFEVTRFASGYTLRVGDLKGIAGYEGRAWVDARDYDPVRLEIRVNDIPSPVPLKDVSNSIDYMNVYIGGVPHVLPASSEIVLTDFVGTENRNRTSYARCRQYAAQSQLTFVDEPAGAEVSKPVLALTLDPGVELEMKLATRLTSGALAVGDAFTAEISRDVKIKGGGVLVPKGARVEGRVSHLEYLQGKVNVWLLGLRLERVTFADKVADLKAKLLFPTHIDRRPSSAGIRDGLNTASPGGVVDVRLRGYTDPNLILFYEAAKLDVRPGFQMSWVTQ